MSIYGLGLILIGIGFLLWPSSKKTAPAATPKRKKSAGNFPLDMLQSGPVASNKKAEAEASKILVKINQYLRAQNLGAVAVSAATSASTWTIELQYPATTRPSKIKSSLADMSVFIGYPSLRALPARKNITTMGIEITRDEQSTVPLSSLLKSKEYQRAKGDLIIPLGISASTGKPLLGDLVTAPHMLLTGSTGSGKSVCLNAMIISLMFKYTPEQLQFIMIDPKRVELNQYSGLDHIIGDIITEAAEAEQTLVDLNAEMERRYTLMAQAGVKKISELKGTKKLPYIICIIEEYADLNEGKHGEKIGSLAKTLAAKSRACGIHLMVVTARPTTSCLPSATKSQLPLRIGGKQNKIGSLVALDQAGAELLRGNGDMLMAFNGELTRFKSPWLDDKKELPNIINYLKSQSKGKSNVMPSAPPAQPTQAMASSPWLSMTINNQSKAITGKVLKGDHKGQALETLSQQALWQLQANLFSCADSKQLLNCYMTANNIPQPNPVTAASLLLGLNQNPSKAAIKRRWSLLINKHHPDKGGSADSAAQINAAKQTMLNAQATA